MIILSPFYKMLCSFQGSRSKS